MSTGALFRVSLAAWSGLTMAVWTLIVSGQVSVGSWAWLNAGILALGLTVIVLVGHRQPARAMSPVLRKGTGGASPRWS